MGAVAHSFLFGSNYIKKLKKNRAKEKKLVSKQNNLRKQARIAIAENIGIFTTKDFAEFLEIEIGSYYNWISGEYDFSEQKAKQFECFLSDITD